MINNSTLVGRLVRDPELRFTQNGTAAASFTLAVNRNFTNQSGDREADFINCVIWRKPAEALANYAKKGSLIGVVGRIQTRNYDNQQGQKVYVTEVVCESFQLLEKKDSSESQSNNSATNQESSSFNQNNQANNDFKRNSDSFGGSSQIDINDDDLPF